MAAVRKSRGRDFMVMTLERKIVLQHADGQLDYFRKLSPTPQISRAAPRKINPVTPD